MFNWILDSVSKLFNGNGLDSHGVKVSQFRFLR